MKDIIYGKDSDGLIVTETMVLQLLADIILECDMTVWKFSPKNKKITLLDRFEEEYKIFVSNVSSYHKIEL